MIRDRRHLLRPGRSAIEHARRKEDDRGSQKVVHWTLLRREWIHPARSRTPSSHPTSARPRSRRAGGASSLSARIASSTVGIRNPLLLQEVAFRTESADADPNTHSPNARQFTEHCLGESRRSGESTKRVSGSAEGRVHNSTSSRQSLRRDQLSR